MRESELYGTTPRRHIIESIEEQERLDLDAAIESKRRRKVQKKRLSYDLLRAISDRVVSKVETLTADAETTAVDGTDRRSVIAVLDDHDTTFVTPDHLAVCGVSFLPANRTAEFRFAVVPRDFVEHLIANPLDLNDKASLPEDVYLYEPEDTPSLYDFELALAKIEERTFPVSAIHKYSHYRQFEYRISEAQRNINMVMDATEDRVRNSHLPQIAR